MPSPSAEQVVENIRRTLHTGSAHYAALFGETLREPGEDELVELSLILGVHWPRAGSVSESKHARRRVEGTAANSA